MAAPIQRARQLAAEMTINLAGPGMKRRNHLSILFSLTAAENSIELSRLFPSLSTAAISIPFIK